MTEEFAEKFFLMLETKKTLPAASVADDLPDLEI